VEGAAKTVFWRKDKAATSRQKWGVEKAVVVVPVPQSRVLQPAHGAPAAGQERCVLVCGCGGFWQWDCDGQRSIGCTRSEGGLLFWDLERLMALS
jgi:hypothetical protein